MPITTTRGTLLPALTAAARTAGASPPILLHVSVSASGGVLTLTGTDGVRATTAMAICGPSDAGAFCLPAKPFLAWVKALPVDTILTLTHDTDAGRCTLTAPGASWNTATLPTEDFPAIKPGTFGCTFPIPAAALAGALQLCLPAISTEETRYYLCGAYFHRGGLVATDGNRVHLTPMPGVPEDMPGVIIPTAAVKAILALAGAKPSGDITLSVSPTRIRAVMPGGVVFRSKTIDGTFPEYERVIPRGHARLLTVGDTPAFATAILALGKQVSTDRSHPVLLTLRGDGGWAITAKGPEGMSATGPSCDTGYQGEALEIGVQARYLAQALAGVTGACCLTFGDAAGPMIVYGAANPDGYRAVVMPRSA